MKMFYWMVMQTCEYAEKRLPKLVNSHVLWGCVY